jgi:hypothetical protein
MPTYAVAIAIVDNSSYAVTQVENTNKLEIDMWNQPSFINHTK